MKINKEIISFLLILGVSLTVRIYSLSQIPNGLSVDEADMGYNAYSIYKTGADVYGRKFPLFFQSLDDYKAAFGIYAPLPAIAAFGLNEFSIRIIPAILGALIPILVFLLSKLLYPKNQYIPIIAALFTVFAPWNIAISRVNLPYIELTFFYLVFLYLFLLALSKNNKFLPLSFIVLAFTLYIYYAAIIYLPPVLLTFLVIFRKKLFKSPKIILLSAIILFIFSLPALIHYLSPQSKTRLNAISVLTADVTLPISIEEIEQDREQGNSFFQILHNRRLVYASALLDNYFDYFNLDYLFVSAKNTRYFYVNNVGLFYLIELPFFLYGLYLIIKRRESSDLLLVAFLIIGPTPAMFTMGSPFPHRVILLLLAIQLISAVGLTTFLTNLVKHKNSVNVRSIILILTFTYSASIYFFLHQYFIHSPREFTSELDNGAWYSTVRDAIPLVNLYKDQYDKVVFTWSQGKLVPPVYYFFYNQFDPRIIQSKSALWTNEPPSYKQIYNQIDNIEFRSINWEQDKNLKNTLFIGYPREFPLDVEVIDRTYLPNGNVHFVFVESQ